MRLALKIPAVTPDQYSADAARALLRRSTTLTLPDGKRVLAVIVFAEVVDDGQALVVTLDYSPPSAARRRRRSQVTTARNRQNPDGDMSQSQSRSQRRSQPAEAT